MKITLLRQLSIRIKEKRKIYIFSNLDWELYIYLEFQRGNFIYFFFRERNVVSTSVCRPKIISNWLLIRTGLFFSENRAVHVWRESFFYRSACSWPRLHTVESSWTSLKVQTAPWPCLRFPPWQPWLWAACLLLSGWTLL